MCIEKNFNICIYVHNIYVYVKDSAKTIKKIDEPIEIKVSSKDDDTENPQEGDNNSLYGLLLAGTFGATLLGALRRKRNM